MTGYGNCPNHPEHSMLNCPRCRTEIKVEGTMTEDAIEVLQKVVKLAYHATAPFLHRSRGKLKCDHCGDEADHQHWIKEEEGLICNNCETDLYRVYCKECEGYVEIVDPCEHRKDNVDEGDDEDE